MSGKVIFDTNFLTYFSDSAGGFNFTPEDASDTLEARFDLLVDQLTDTTKEIIIPSPVLAEVLAAPHANESKILSLISSQSQMKISDFDQRQSIEFGHMFRSIKRGPENRNSFKFDLLILACARVESASAIYTADENLQKKARNLGIQAISFQDLDRPFATNLIEPDLFDQIH